ncbi:protein of unknown function DUF1349 [Gloeothece citriformis PCC 7424]|uniref:Regulation of enolase protein 1 n=1 Tax=Gloeothece citriformis (strain PCC 7424) TaxID=65393 RepID=B7K730_GLOC7|nr:DUF1349 domain-containing protein [Gloeothece citriformis]ACK69598.1 protein of unknown function DUF1349 [Gloeothece citriformis PCC 7424]
MAHLIFQEDFNDTNLPSSLFWFNEPQDWKIENSCLIIRPEKTDFWQKTHYGFERDNGHCLLYQASGDFSLTTGVKFRAKHQYDQAGLIIRYSKDFWLKTSVEYEDKQLSRLGVVVTNFGYSDWSTQDFSSTIDKIYFKIIKQGQDYTVQFQVNDASWSQLRIAHLHQEALEVQCGLYACSPVEIGYQAEFDFIEIQQLS